MDFKSSLPQSWANVVARSIFNLKPMFAGMRNSADSQSSRSKQSQLDFLLWTEKTAGFKEEEKEAHSDLHSKRIIVPALAA